MTHPWERERFLEQWNPGNYGQTIRLQPSTARPTDTGTLLRPSGGDQGAAVVTLCLSAAPVSGVFPAGSTSRVVADVSWGAGGGSHKATVDVGRGTQITLPATAIEVSARYIGGAGPDMIVSASLSYGSRPGEQTVTLTDGPFLVNAAGPVDLVSQVPPFARSVQILFETPDLIFTGWNDVTIEIRSDDAAGPGVPFVRYVYLPSSYATYPVNLSLPGWAATVRVRATGVGASGAWALYGLAL